MQRKVLFLDSVHPILKESLEKHGYVCIEDYSCDKHELISNISSYFGLVVRSRISIDVSIIDAATNLKFIARSGSGLENIDVDYARSKGIRCFNSPEGNRDAVGEHAIGMLLTLFNHINTSDLEVRAGKWLREGNRGVELGGKTVGIIGFGNTGSAFAKKLSGFDCRILATDTVKTAFGNTYVEEASLDLIFKEADVVSLHIPQNKANLYYANDAFFKAFQKDIYFINTSRGKVLETAALVNALKNQKVKGACLDVLEYELKSFENLVLEDLPEDFQFLSRAKNVLLTPHVAGWTTESYEKLSSTLYKKIREAEF